MSTKLFSVVSAMLAVICLVFLVLNLVQGPRLRRVAVNTTEVIKQPNQRLILYANQPLATINQDQIKIEPKADFASTSSGQAVAIQFTQRLRYNTTYHISANHVSSSYRKRAQATFKYTFKTADPAIYYIHRNHGSNLEGFFDVKKPDQIMQTSLSGRKTSQFYSAGMIQDYVISGNKLVVVTVNDDKTNSLFLVDIKTKQSTELSLPAAGTVRQLHASPNQRSVGFSFSSNEKDYSKRKYERVLFTMDVAPPRPAHPVDGLNKKPLQIIDWQFAPDGTTILAQAFDTNLLLIDTNGTHDPVPLGQFTSIGNFSYNGAKIAADSGLGPVVLDPIKHSRIMPQFKQIDGLDPYPLNLTLLANGDGYLARLQVYGQDYRQSNDYFLLSRQGSDNIIYKVDTVQSNVDGYALSPNDQYLAVEQSSIKYSESDQYPDNSKSYSVHTQLIDVGTGKPVRDIEGFGLAWN